MFTSARIAEYVEALQYEDLSPEVVEKAKHLTLDSVGCCLGAFTSPPSKALRDRYGGYASESDATVFGTERTTPVEYAGLINSTMVRYLDYNDAYVSEGRACHPSDHIPSLVSIAETEGAGGRELIEAIVLAYEIEGLGLDTGTIWKQGYDYVTWGIFSSVASVGKLMGLSTDELVDAMGICGASSVALGASRLGDVRMWKGVAHPYVTHNAIQACQMARSGITGPQEIFEGEGGFFETVAKQELAIDHLGGIDGEPYRILDAHIKPFPCGYYMQTAVLGARDLVAEHDVDPSAIESVSVETFHRAAQVLASPEKWSTDLTRETADHSLPYTVSIAILEGDVTPTHYSPEYLRNETVHELMQRVTVEENESLNEFIAENPTAIPMVVEITTDAETYRTRVDYPIGHAQNPMDMAGIEDKMREMAQPLLTDAQIERIVEFCSDLDRRDSVDDLVSNLVI